MNFPLPDALITPFLLRALDEDIAHGGDLTTLATIDPQTEGTATLNAREAGVASGVHVAALAFETVDPACTMTEHVADGETIAPGTTILTVTGPDMWDSV